MNNITFEELVDLLGRCERQLKTENNSIYAMYEMYLLGNKKFVNDCIRILRDCKLFVDLSAAHGYEYPSPMPQLNEIMLYAYLLPFEKKYLNGVDVPDFFDDDTWENFYYNKARRRKYYYLDRIEKNENGTVTCTTIKMTEYVHDNYLQLRSAYDLESEADIVESLVDKIRSRWSNTVRDAEFAGPPLCDFPLASELTVSSKRTLFFIDIGSYIFKQLPELRINNEEDIPLIIPQDFLSHQIVSFTKSMVRPEIEYNPSEERLEIRSNKYHTMFDVISLANELSDITDVDEQEKKIEAVIAELKKDDTTFPNVTARDLVGFSNIISMFFQKDPDSVTLDTSLWELCVGIMRGIPSDYLLHHGVKEFIGEALSILHKWSTYHFELGAKGIITPFNYIADAYTSSPGALRRGILGIENSYLESKDDTSKNASVAQLRDMPVEELKAIPVRLEMSVFLKEIVEHEQMTKQFSIIYQKLSNPTTKALYTYIEFRRKEKNYPANLTLSYSELAENFVVDRKVRFINIVKKCIDELLLMGVIKNCCFYDSAAVWVLEFEKLL